MADRQKTQTKHLEETAHQFERVKDGAKLDAEKNLSKAKVNPKICPECGHVFRGNGWDGIDAHWKAKHEKIMPYLEAWPLLKAETYKA